MKEKKLASTIINYSLNVKENEFVLIEAGIIAKNLVKELVKEIVNKKANVYVRYNDSETSSLIEENTKDEKIDFLYDLRVFDVEHFDCFIKIRCNNNDYDIKNIPSEVTKKIGIKLQDVNDIRINERKWVLLNYPTNVDSYKAKMNYNEFYDYCFDAMCYDYQKMNDDIKPLKDLMEKTDEVRITGPDTDLRFSIKNLPVIPCVGNMNIPDGETYTAPVKTSVNGYIKYNTPSPYQGYVFEGVKLTFKDGKIISATCDNVEESYKKKLEEIFNTDEGARYVGEFSLGFNPMIKYPMGDILYDEKIMGSIHFTPGCCYKDCDNGNKSSIHWDLVLIQREDYGGGCIYFDHRLIRKDGIFVLDELKKLN
ncbi:MAG TPA: aminopeptidase [Bacilli bacterium]|jgi:hypothetical protein|nr:aminopeptidase [Bacilli bacterium]